MSEGGDLAWTVEEYPARAIALTHVRLIDCTGAPARDDQTIVILGERILAVGPSSQIDIPEGAEVHDLRGHTVLPGFVQLHEHTWFAGIAEPVHADWSVERFDSNSCLRRVASVTYARARRTAIQCGHGAVLVSSTTLITVPILVKPKHGRHSRTLFGSNKL